MTHEPECFYDGERDDTEWRDAEDSPCICEQLTLAYKRGLLAAADIADARQIDMLYCMKNDYCHTKAAGANLVADDIRYAAVRGEWQA